MVWTKHGGYVAALEHGCKPVKDFMEVVRRKKRLRAVRKCCKVHLFNVESVGTSRVPT